MIEVKRLSLCKGGNRFGSCNSCGKNSDEDDLMRITFITNLGQGTSIVLCEDCINAMLGAIEQELARGDNNG